VKGEIVYNKRGLATTSEMSSTRTIIPHSSLISSPSVLQVS